ncbi:MAG: hypothetical protein HYX67_14050 [Candidatus Melainabacteria bacterium]|nr:hypothetical protein [Candidatus Melainabacteria bacterium]
MPQTLSVKDNQANGFIGRAVVRLIILALVLVNSPNPLQAEPLQGRIEHSHKLPAVNKLLKPGIHYDDTANKAMSNAWVRIPTWLAGVWASKEETAVFRENYQNGVQSREHRTFTAKSKFAYGKQVDKTGQIWHYVGVPYTSDPQMSGQIEYHQVLDKDVTPQSTNKVAVRTKVVVIKVRKPSGDIAETYQQESRRQSARHRVAAFAVVDEEYGRDLKSLFRQYLIAQNLASLVPD